MTQHKRYGFYIQYGCGGRYEWHYATGANKSDAAQKVARAIGGTRFSVGLIRSIEC